MATDPYEALGLTQSATAADIRKAYRRLVRSSHPDLHPDDAGAETRFKAITAAHDLLKEPETRARLDAGEIDPCGAERAPRRFYRDHAGAGGTGTGQTRGFAGSGEPSDIFAHILRGRARDPGFAPNGPDRRHALDVTFLKAALGGKIRITLPDGETLEVHIPRGLADGQTLRLRGHGDAGYDGGPAGDALVTVRVRPHPVFRRADDDILITLPVTIDEAVLGARITAPTINGPVTVSIPKAASSGRILRLRGRGVARVEGRAGDALMELQIVVPPDIDPDLAAFLQDWRKTHGHDPRKTMMEETPE